MVERLQALQGSEEVVQIRQLRNLQKNRLQLVDQAHRKHDNSQSPHRYHQIKHVLDHLPRKAVDVKGHKPLADPHGSVHSQFDEHVRVKLFVAPLQHVLEESGENIIEGEAVLVQSQQHVLFIGGKMHEHLEAIPLGIAHEGEVADHEVDALRVAHLREVVGYPLQHIFKLPLLLLLDRPVEGARYVLLDLHEAFVDHNPALLLIVLWGMVY